MPVVKLYFSYFFHTEPSDETVPTIGFTNEEVLFDKHTVTIYDLGGGARIRGIWRNYYADVYGIIYVVDTSRADRFDEARQELKSVLMDEKIQGKPCLVYGCLCGSLPFVCLNQGQVYSAS
jgi:ADP-ribosylation factor-like protein 13B